MASTVVLVHGGFLGPWIWDDVRVGLGSEDIASILVDLPTVATGGTFGDDVQCVRSVLDVAGDAVVLCGHSYAGMVITQSASAAKGVCHLVYLAAAVPDAGQSMADLAAAAPSEGPGESVRFRADGLAELEPASAVASLFNDCDPARAAAAVARLRPMNVLGAGGPVTAAAWREIPATFVRGEIDPMPEMVSPAFWSVAPDLVVMPTGHCPSWSRPDLVAALLAERARDP